MQRDGLEDVGGCFETGAHEHHCVAEDELGGAFGGWEFRVVGEFGEDSAAGVILGVLSCGVDRVGADRLEDAQEVVHRCALPGEEVGWEEGLVEG